MKSVIFAVRDRALDAFGNPFAAPTVGLAVRSFADEVNNPQSPMNAHPDDFDLYSLGTFDPDTGLISPNETPRMVAVGKEHVKPPK